MLENMKRRSWCGLSERNKETGKKGRFPDEIAVAPKRKGSDFCGGSC